MFVIFGGFPTYPSEFSRCRPVGLWFLVRKLLEAELAKFLSSRSELLWVVMSVGRFAVRSVGRSVRPSVTKFYIKCRIFYIV